MTLHLSKYKASIKAIERILKIYPNINYAIALASQTTGCPITAVAYIAYNLTQCDKVLQLAEKYRDFYKYTEIIQ